MLASVIENLFSQIHAGKWSFRVQLGNMIHVITKDRGLHVLGIDHVIRDKQKILAFDPFVFGTDRLKLFDGPNIGVAVEDQVQHRHEVRFTGAKTAV